MCWLGRRSIMKFNFSYHYYIRIYVCLIWCQDVSKLQSFIHSFFRFYWKERNVCDLIRSTKQNKNRKWRRDGHGKVMCYEADQSSAKFCCINDTPCVVCQSKKIALFVLYLLFIRRQNILSYWIQYFHFFLKFTFFLNFSN